ncbi:MAG: transposase [Planctomycetes bacterium]|nr:transposase [Planctomycetota bacterium]
MSYVSAKEHALVNMRLYLPRSWAKDRVRRKKCRVPKGMRYKLRGLQLARMGSSSNAFDDGGMVFSDRNQSGKNGLRQSPFPRSKRASPVVARGSRLRWTHTGRVRTNPAARKKSTRSLVSLETT